MGAMTGMKSPEEEGDDGWINLVDVADQADVQHFSRLVVALQHQFLGAYERAILAGQPDCLAAVAVDEVDDVLVDFAQHHLDHVHGLFVGDAHALDKLALFADLLQQVIDLRTAAVDDHRIHANQLEQHHIACEAFLQLGVGHGVAAVFDDDRLVEEALDIRQGFGEGMGFLGCGSCGQ